MVVARGYSEIETGKSYWMGVEFQFGKMEAVWRSLLNNVNILNATELQSYKCWIVTLVLWLCHYNFFFFNLPLVRLSDFTFTFHFHALEKEMATHSSVLAWRIPGTGEPGGLLSLGSHRVRHDWSDLAAAAAASTETSWRYWSSRNE